MHLSVRHAQALDAEEAPVNPEQQPADILVLSFTDSDLAAIAAAFHAAPTASPSLALTNLAPMRHPLSVDLYIEQVASQAKVILARLLGGHDWWPYGAEELARLARQRGIALLLLSGDGRHDERLTALSTVAPAVTGAAQACFDHGGTANIAALLHLLRSLARGETPAPPVAVAVPPAGLYRAETATVPCLGQALLLFYRSHYLAADTAPIDALVLALAERGLEARACMLTSLKDKTALAALRTIIGDTAPDVILDATAFSAGDGLHPLAGYGVPILQCALANTPEAAWAASTRGLSASDLAMHVVLPEADGRIFTRAVSFKGEAGFDAATQYRRIAHNPLPDRIAYVADLAQAWVRLGKTAPRQRRLALVLSDYPDRQGRQGYAVGLDAPQSALEILHLLHGAGYMLGDLPPDAQALMSRLGETEFYPLARYRQRLAALPADLRDAICAAWGEPEQDGDHRPQGFSIRAARLGHLVAALQPDRGGKADRRSDYHDPALPPRHGYLAFYWWLRDVAGIDALIHLGTHGNLEWLPGKNVALSAACAPEAALGPVPVVYPYIVCDPGEAAQAKRRLAAVALSHLTPPLAPVTLAPGLAELEMLVDEYSAADGLDARRMRHLRGEIVARARQAGLPGANEAAADEEAVLALLETQLCDIKEQRVGDGLHVFGQAPPPEQLAGMAAAMAEAAGGAADQMAIAARLREAAANEAHGLLTALSAGFVAPGPGGSPVRGRLDILPTGSNMVSVDPRLLPTPTAHVIGQRAAAEFVHRYLQDHGDWPRRVMLDLWGSASLRNGGDEIAQALCLMGVMPRWNTATGRVDGFEILAPDAMQWPRIDVCLRISGLFRDIFATIITLFDDAVRAVARLPEPDDVNPLAGATRGLEGEALRAATWRIFGNAPQAFGAGLTDLLDRGAWQKRDELGAAYIAASRYAYGRDAFGLPQQAALEQRISSSDALIHMQDQRISDVLSHADFADAEGGFAAAAAALGARPALYHVDSSRVNALKVRSLAEEISLTLQARALNPHWIAGQMRHGYAGGAALADTVDQLFAFAASTDAVQPGQFEALYAAYCSAPEVSDFLAQHNPAAQAAMQARFAEAIRRGLWNPRRNAVWRELALPLEAAP